MGKDKEKIRQDARPYIHGSRLSSRQPSPPPSSISLSVPPARSPALLSPNATRGGFFFGVAGQSQVATIGSTDPRPGRVSHPLPDGAKKGRKHIHRNVFAKLGLVLKKSVTATSVLKPLVDGIEEVTDIFQNFGMGNNEPQLLIEQLDSLLGKLNKEAQIEIDRVKARHTERSHSRHGDVLKDTEDLSRCCQRVNEMVACLALNIDVSAFRVVNEYITESRLNGLKQTATMSGVYNSAESDELGRRTCTDHTRVEVIKSIMEWAHQTGPAQAYWLNGMAGTGKTTISYTICERLKERNMLGASFFCSRSLPQCRNVNVILPLIAYQLARFSSPFRCLLARELEMDPDVHTKALRVQFENMIVKPLLESQSTLRGRKVVIVIGALDECESSQGVRQLLDLLIKEELNLPIKFFISSRPESEIYPRMNTLRGMKPRPHLILHELSTIEIFQDIETYFRTELRDFNLPDSYIARLVTHSGILFIYASTAVKYIQEGAEQGELSERLDTMLGLTSVSHSLQERDIDMLYTTILTRALDNPRLESESKEKMIRVLWIIICAQEPLTVGGIAGLLNPLTKQQVEALIQPLRSVLHVTGSDALVTTLHASFPDFMLNRHRSARFYRSPTEYHSIMCRACFDVIRTHIPQFNVCALESSFYLDKEVPDLEKRANIAISNVMYYACRHWATHLENSGMATELEILLMDFLSARLLLWMEILNLKRRIREGPKIIQVAKRWCINLDASQEIISLAQDAWSFVLTFTGNVVSLSSPHIYVSMIPLWPKSAPVAINYLKRFRSMIETTGTGLQNRQLALLATWPLKQTVHCMRYLPDSDRVLVVRDNHVQVLDGATGHPEADPLEWEIPSNCSSSILSAEVSWNGTRIAVITRTSLLVYRLEDSTLLFRRDLNRGAQDHDYHTPSIVFLLNNDFLALARNDNLRVYDIQNGTILASSPTGSGLFSGQIPLVSSPDSTSFIAGCSDSTIRAWKIHSGSLQSSLIINLVPRCNDTRDRIACLAFSPDGKRIASGSLGEEETCPIHIWGANDGRLLLGPFGEGDYIATCVAFSPDGLLLVSGTDVGTVRVHNALTGQAIFSSLQGHSERAWSIVFSHDGSRLISIGSEPNDSDEDEDEEEDENEDVNEGTSKEVLRVWDVLNAYKWPCLDSQEQYTDSIKCITFSPDGELIASGSRIGYIRIYDTKTGASSLTLFAEETVKTLAFSLRQSEEIWILALTESGDLWRWDVHTGAPSFRYKLHAYNQISSPFNSGVAIFSLDGSCIVSYGEEELKTWDIANRFPIQSISYSGSGFINSVTPLLDGSFALVGLDPTHERLFVSVKGNMSFLYPPNVLKLPVTTTVSPDGTLVVMNDPDGSLLLWNLALDQEPQWQYESRSFANKYHEPSSLHFSPNGNYLFLGAGNSVTLLNSCTGRVVLGPLNIHTRHIYPTAFSPDKVHFATVSDNGAIRIWDITDIARSTPTSQLQLVVSPSTSEINEDSAWNVNKNGWMINDRFQYLVWIPLSLRPSVLACSNPTMISTEGSIRVDYSNALIGEKWAECYTPAD